MVPLATLVVSLLEEQQWRQMVGVEPLICQHQNQRLRIKNRDQKNSSWICSEIKAEECS